MIIRSSSINISLSKFLFNKLKHSSKTNMKVTVENRRRRWKLEKWAMDRRRTFLIFGSIKNLWKRMVKSIISCCNT
jgi:hypothetical protein